MRFATILIAAANPSLGVEQKSPQLGCRRKINPMTIEPDFVFRIGKTSCLEGRGWRGLMALALLLTPLVIAAYHSPDWFQALLRAVKF